MFLAAQEISEEVLGLPCRNGEYTEAKVDHIDGTAIVELPPMSNGCRERQLARR